MRALLSFLVSRNALFTLAASSCILPFGVLALYSHPALDDFGIGYHLRGLPMTQYVAEVYRHSSGRYSATLFSVVLKFFGAYPQAYSALILFGLITFVLSVYGVAISVSRYASKGIGLALALGSFLVIAAFVNFPWPAEGIFWLTGSIAYLYPVTLMSVLVALLCRLYARPPQAHWLQWAVAILIGFLIPGFSEITALLLPLVYIGVASALRAPVLRWSWGGLGAAIVLGSLLTLASPAHFAQWKTLRSGHGVGSLVKAVALATGGTLYCLVNWLGNGLLLLLVMLGLPLATTLAQADTRFSLVHRLTRQLWLWPLLTLVGVWLAFLFCYTASGLAPALRVKNLLYLYFIAGGLLSAYGWVSRLGIGNLSRLVARPVQLGIGGWLLVALLSDHNVHLTHANIGVGSNTVVQAYRDWLDGSAARYDQQQRARVRLVQAASPSDGPLGLAPLRERPRTIFYYDISANMHLWGNVSYAAFYGGPPVYVQQAE